MMITGTINRLKQFWYWLRGKRERRHWFKLFPGAIVRTFTAGDKVSIGDFVHVDEDGTVKGNAQSGDHLAGFAVANADKGQPVEVVTRGHFAFNAPDLPYYSDFPLPGTPKIAPSPPIKMTWVISDKDLHINALEEIGEGLNEADNYRYMDALMGMSELERRKLLLGDWQAPDDEERTSDQ